MRSVLEEVAKLRGGRPATLDRTNTNRYRILLSEADGSKTAYYFTTPIYRASDGKLVKLAFEKKGKTAVYEGSNATVTLAEKIKLTNAEGRCLVSLPGTLGTVEDEYVKWGGCVLYPTMNGFACKAKSKRGFTFELETTDKSLAVRANDKYFALMREKFRPFVVVSCIGTVDKEEKTVISAKITYQKTEDDTYLITVQPWKWHDGEDVLFEINLYENKLLQDTTVESGSSYSNNAFGTMAYLGNTTFYGEQWLYARPDIGRMHELRSARIESAVLHMPLHAPSDIPLRAFGITARFCSFGANWHNKVHSTPEYTDALLSSDRVDLDVTPFFADSGTGYLKPTNGWIVKPMVKNGRFAAVSTADSCFAPLILEVKFS